MCVLCHIKPYAKAGTSAGTVSGDDLILSRVTDSLLWFQNDAFNLYRETSKGSGFGLLTRLVVNHLYETRSGVVGIVNGSKHEARRGRAEVQPHYTRRF